MKKPTNDEIVAALRCDDSVLREAMAQRLEQKRPAHRPQDWKAPYNRAAVLEVLFSFRKNDPLMKNAEAIRATADWFEMRGVVISENKIKGLYYDIQGVRIVETWEAWERFKQDEEEKRKKVPK